MPSQAADASTTPTLAEPSVSDLPNLAALFLIRFDQRIGYTIAWQRAIPEQLEGVVEFKSLPSGLHNVEEDLIYFVHGSYAGLSAFTSGAATPEERNINFVAVGCLVPLSYGRLGRNWLHADGLKNLAGAILKDAKQTQMLDVYWMRHAMKEATYTQRSGKLSSLDAKQPERSRSNSRLGRNRGMSESVALAAPWPGRSLATFHPAMSIPKFFNTIGPLVFPLYRAALLRKKILYVGAPPVRPSCDFVYSHSVFSSIPQSISESLQSNALARIRPIFSVGIHDIPVLEGSTIPTSATDSNQSDLSLGFESQGPGWIACTTDEILSTKTKLYDVRVELPSHSLSNEVTSWPSVFHASGTRIMATQRDFRRFKTLQRHHLYLNLRHGRYQAYREDEDDHNDNNIDNEFPSFSSFTPYDEILDDRPWPSEDQIVEPAPWASIAYDAYMWWASAGERRAELDEEDEQDRKLLGVISELVENDISSPSRTELSHGAIEMALVAYFHQMTAQMFATLLHLVRSAGFEVHATAERSPGDSVVVEKEDLMRMGLDVWSEADRDFVRQIVGLYFGLQADVRGASVECCGIKIY